ncbi:hypothetical protein IJE86_08105 [bacterium]|nr:hypothetical protein [bacterium]
MIKVEVRPLAGFEDDYVRYTARKAVVESEVREEFERVLKERTEKLDQLIALTSESVEVEYPDEDGEVTEENTETVE